MGTIDNMLDRFEEKKKRVERLARAFHDLKNNGLWPVRDLASVSSYDMIAKAILDYMDSLGVE